MSIKKQVSLFKIGLQLLIFKHDIPIFYLSCGIFILLWALFLVTWYHERAVGHSGFKGSKNLGIGHFINTVFPGIVSSLEYFTPQNSFHSLVRNMHYFDNYFIFIKNSFHRNYLPKYGLLQVT